MINSENPVSIILYVVYYNFKKAKQSGQYKELAWQLITLHVHST